MQKRRVGYIEPVFPAKFEECKGEIMALKCQKSLPPPDGALLITRSLTKIPDRINTTIAQNTDPNAATPLQEKYAITASGSVSKFDERYGYEYANANQSAVVDSVRIANVNTFDVFSNILNHFLPANWAVLVSTIMGSH